jgi:hypothetical protein
MKSSISHYCRLLLIVSLVLSPGSLTSFALSTNYNSIDIVGDWSLALEGNDTGSTIRFTSTNQGLYIDSQGQETPLNEVQLNGNKLKFKANNLYFDLTWRDDKFLGFVRNLDDKSGQRAQLKKR